jgi:CO/xanthine dehydrogenase Mo-binding subunit
MRGFGAVQACFGYESQMDRLAEKLGMHPVALRVKNAMSQGSRIITGQEIDMPLPMAQMLERVRDLPMPVERTGSADPADQRTLPGGVAGTTRGEGVVRGVGYGVGLKNLCFSEGFDDYSTARVRLEVVAGEPVVLVHTAAAEVGQGLVTVKGQIARTELGVEKVAIAPSDTQVGSAGSSSASRQSYMTGGAVKTACEAVREAVFALAREQGIVPDSVADSELSLTGGKIVARSAGALVSLADLLGDSASGGTVVERTREHHHRPTEMLDPTLGQGASHTQFGMCVHRAVVDAVQDVGKVLHPQQLAGQIQGASAQGLGLALMEEIQVKDSVIRNPSFTDYLIPTILDMPPMRIDVLEHPDPHAPYGLRGAGEPPTLSSTPAVVAAVRDATKRPLTHAPVRPEDIVGIDL